MAHAIWAAKETVMEMTPLNIALICLAVAGVWAIVEVALTLRTSRKKLDELTTSVNETINGVTPIVAKLDGVVDELNPALKQVEPLLEKVGTAVDAVSLDLIHKSCGGISVAVIIYCLKKSYGLT